MSQDFHQLPERAITLNVFAEGSSEDIAQALAPKGSYTIRRHETLDSLLDAIETDNHAVVVFEATASSDVVQTLAAIANRSADTPGVILGENLPISAVRALLLLRRWDILELPTSIDALSEAIQRVSAMPAMSEPDTQVAKQGKCWAFVSPIGGGGATLVSVETAYQLSQSGDGSRTCLIDLNFFDGSCANYLNCDPNLSLPALETSPDRIDATLLKALTTTHRCGLDLIAAPRTTDMNAFPSRETTLRMVEVACEVYDHVIIDMPRWPMTWTKDIVLGADETLLISELSVPALKAARDWILDFDSDAVPGMSRVKTVLNRKQKSLFGSNVTIEQAEKAIQQRVFSAVHSDWASALAAVNLGQPVSMAKPNSTISKDVASLVQLLNDPKQTADQTRADKRVA